MASLTTNISSVSLTVSGTTTQSKTISWTCPTVPSGSTISSCTLTGTATASMSKGSATIKVNGTTVSSGSNFTINLGTANTTSSVTATAVGGNKNAAGTVTISNLVYTVNYTEPVVTYTITFKDWDGTVLKTQTVNSGSAATAPANPTRSGYEFTGWDKTFVNVTADITVTAQYKKNTELRVKENGSWTTSIGKVYKKVSGIWVEQNDSWTDLFDTDTSYVAKPKAPVATLCSDGTLIFTDYQYTGTNHGDVVQTWTGWPTREYDFLLADYAPWCKSAGVGGQNYSTDILSIQYEAYDTHPKSVAYWFIELPNVTTITLNNLDTSTTTDMYRMFYDCESLTSIDVSNFNTSNVTNMSDMFYDCNSLTFIDISNFDLSNVTNMSGMFSSCGSLTAINLGSFNVRDDVDTSLMFEYCDALKTIYVKDEAARTRYINAHILTTGAIAVVGSPN